MTALPPVESFRFETEYDTSEITRARRNLTQKTIFGLTEDQMLMAIGVVGIVLLFWKFTISLGAGLLAVGTFLWAMRERSRTIRKRYEGLSEPPTQVHVGATESRYWIRGPDFSAESGWGRVINGFEYNGMLLVQSWNMPRVLFPIEDLRRAGLYDTLRALIDEHSAVYRQQMAAARGRASET